MRKPQHLNSASEVLSGHSRFGKQFGIINVKTLTPYIPARSPRQEEFLLSCGLGGNTRTGVPMVAMPAVTELSYTK